MLKKSLVLYFLLSCFFIGFAEEKHPFHLSVSEIRYNAESQTYQVSCKLFINDFEDALALKHNVKIDINKAVNEEQNKKAYSFYTDKHLALFSDQKPVLLHILGAEIEDSAVWIYYESDKMPQPKSFYIKNTLLCDYFQDQANIVNLDINGQKKVQRLNCVSPEFKLDF